MGLAARAIEAAEIATLTLTLLPAYTRVIGTPRVVGINYPFGRPFGNPGDADGQRAVLRAALHALAVIDRPGGAVQLPFVWPQSPALARGKLKEPPPIARLLQQKPWLLLKFLRGEIGE